MQAFQVRSKSNPDSYHTVHIDGDESDCTCTAAAFNRACRHVQIARELMEAEQKALASNIHEAIGAIYGEVGYVRKQAGGKLGYSYASETALIEALRPAMVTYGVYMSVPEVADVSSETYTTSRDSVMHMVRLRATVRFTHAPSETWIDVQAVGQGADSGDKAANKAMTGAYKYALRQTFCIETGDDPDGQPSREQERRPPKQEQKPPPKGDESPPAGAHKNPEVDTDRLFEELIDKRGLNPREAVSGVTGDSVESLDKRSRFIRAIEAWALANNVEGDLVDAVLRIIDSRTDAETGEIKDGE